ncbi:hypothetical protein EXIGLDRAFT_692514 [Exidia glandulosa HHB12029]|uniref:Uncharacterized protein n=1 Tax=Exidia glandulosa HHB12029 TaxID=1314781 RepID=A0A166MK40_EXIGL|nr:hypothetical protein EXIGLDRAFT_692514 [Exidia glandulosa HHB12029]
MYKTTRTQLYMLLYHSHHLLLFKTHSVHFLALPNIRAVALRGATESRDQRISRHGRAGWEFNQNQVVDTGKIIRREGSKSQERGTRDISKVEEEREKGVSRLFPHFSLLPVNFPSHAPPVWMRATPAATSHLQDWENGAPECVPHGFCAGNADDVDIADP